MTNAESPRSEAELEHLLSEPSEQVVEAMRRIPGDIVILGAGGKMGPTLAMMAKRAADLAGTTRRITAVARFSDGKLANRLAGAGIDIRRADLLCPADVSALPDADIVIYMVGQKFGTSRDSARTWAVNAFIPGLVAARYPGARIVAFSTGNVYPLWPAASEGPTESDAVAPVGEYAQSALARERVLTHFSLTNQTPMALLRLNYAVEPRYGVLRDIAEKVWEGCPIDVSMGFVNVIGQRDANAIALLALGHCATPPLVLNLTGIPAVSVRTIAQRLAHRLGRVPEFSGMEAPTALLSNAAQMVGLFGEPPTPLDLLIQQVASWLEHGGASLGKATHFEQRDGRF